MSDVTDCLYNIIGLSQTECACWDTDKPDTYNVSDSGIYLTDLEGLGTLDGLVNCENGSVWDAMEKAKLEAIKVFIADANGLLLQKFRLKRQPFTGKIGETQNRTVKTPTHTYAGLTAYCANIISGTMTINAIGTLFTVNGTVDVSIQDNLGIIYGTYTLTTQANRYVNNSITPLELPLHSEETGHLQYFFYYTYNAANKPYSNQLHCGCGSFKPIWSFGKPYFNDSSIEPRYNWSKYAMVGGFEVNDLDDLENPDKQLSGTTVLNGLTIDVALKCKTAEVFCKDSLNYDSNPLANAMAFAIRFKAAHILVNRLLTDNGLNRPKLINREAWMEQTKKWDIDYQNYMGYVVENVYIKTNDCFECKDVIRAMKAGVFA